MDKTIREQLFQKMEAGNLSEVIPSLEIVCSDQEKFCVPALLTTKEDRVIFTLYFDTPTNPLFEKYKKQVYFNKNDFFCLSGRIAGRFLFRCQDAMPPSKETSWNSVASSVEIRAQTLEIIPEGADTLTHKETNHLLKRPPSTDDDKQDFQAHFIFHGVKLGIFSRQSGSQSVSTHDFLGKSTSSSLDTYLFEDDGYESAIIQVKDELHLHIRGNHAVDEKEVEKLITDIAWAVGFAHGFNPWYCFKQIRYCGRVICHELRPRFRLKTSQFSPLANGVGYGFMDKPESPLYQLIPNTTKGLGNLSEDQRKKLDQLIWIFRSNATNDMPYPTKILILLSLLDGLLKLISGVSKGTDEVWKEASNKLGYDWENWTNPHYKTRKKYRDDLAHGELWKNEELPFNEIYPDYEKISRMFVEVIRKWIILAMADKELSHKNTNK